MEIEAKFSVEDPEKFAALKEAGTLAGRSLRSGDEFHLRDRYYDTADGALFTMGYALRERSGANGVWITLKSITPSNTLIQQREEVETQLGAGRSLENLKSGTVRNRLKKLIGKTPLVPIVELEQERIIRLLKDGRRVIAEICLDRVKVDRNDQNGGYLELEVELRKGGTTAELKDILSVLQDDWQFEPQLRSKYIRALETVGHPIILKTEPVPNERVKRPAKKPGICSDDTMAIAAQKTLRLHFHHMCYHEPGTRLGEDIESLHDMRVATRRLRAAFRVFKGYLPSKAARPLLIGLKETGLSLGAVRDLDVFWEKTVRYLDTQPPDEQTDLAALRIAWEKQHISARKNLTLYLDSPVYRQFKDRFQEILENRKIWISPDLSEARPPRPNLLQHVVPIAVYQRLADVLAYDPWVTGPAVPVERLHQLRIAAKRLRYTIEFFQEVLGNEAEYLISRLKSLQDHLGDLQDTVIAQRLLEAFLLWGTLDETLVPSNSSPHQPVLFRDPEVNAYLHARQREMEILIETFPQAWAEIREPYFSHSIATMLMAW